MRVQWVSVLDYVNNPIGVCQSEILFVRKSVERVLFTAKFVFTFNSLPNNVVGVKLVEGFAGGAQLTTTCRIPTGIAADAKLVTGKPLPLRFAAAAATRLKYLSLSLSSIRFVLLLVSCCAERRGR